MQLRKYRWSKHYESAEEELVQLLAAKRIEAERWTAGPMEELEPHVSASHTQVWCAEGSLVVTVDNKRISLQPGDTLELPANTEYQVTAGMSGCVCYQYPLRER